MRDLLAVVRESLYVNRPEPPQPLPAAVKQSSFSKCHLKCSGDSKEISHFVNSITDYKDSENISDEIALKSFPLLLDGKAEVWWQGVKDIVESFDNVDNALELLQSNFGIIKEPHQVYLKIFSEKQKDGVKSYWFICQKRALFS